MAHSLNGIVPVGIKPWCGQLANGVTCSAVLKTVTEWFGCLQNKVKLEARNIRLEEEERLISILGPVKAREEAMKLEKVGMSAKEY